MLSDICTLTGVGPTRQHERQEYKRDGSTEEEHANKVCLDDEAPCFLQECASRETVAVYQILLLRPVLGPEQHGDDGADRKDEALRSYQQTPTRIDVALRTMQ